MSTQYRLVQSGKTASGGCSAGQGSSELQRHGLLLLLYYMILSVNSDYLLHTAFHSNKNIIFKRYMNLFCFNIKNICIGSNMKVSIFCGKNIIRSHLEQELISL
jgi:hypothetical protein